MASGLRRLLAEARWRRRSCLVSHAIVTRLIVLAALGLGPDRLWSVDASPAGITEIEYLDGWATVHRMNTLRIWRRPGWHPPASGDDAVKTPTQLPRGARIYLPDEAARKRHVEERLFDVFRRWGYREIVTPTFEYCRGAGRRHRRRRAGAACSRWSTARPAGCWRCAPTSRRRSRGSSPRGCATSPSRCGWPTSRTSSATTSRACRTTASSTRRASS